MQISYPKVRQMCKSHPRMMGRIINRMKKRTIRHWTNICITNDLNAAHVIIKHLADNNIDKDIV